MNKQFALNNSISLVQLFFQKRWLILSTILCVTCITGFFIFKHQPTYEAKIILGPLSHRENSVLKDKFSFKWETVNHIKLTTENLYTIFTYNLYIPFLHGKFFDEIYFPAISEKLKKEVRRVKLYKDFGDAFYATMCTHEKKVKTVITIRANEPQTAIKQMQEFISFFEYQSKDYLTQIIATHLKKTVNLESTPFFTIDSPIFISNTIINDKLKCTLIIGILGGLLLGCIFSILSMNKHSMFLN